MKMAGWGNFPKIDAHVSYPQSITQCVEELFKSDSLITRGMGRSYGDSSLSNHILASRYLSHFQAFDETTGLLTCESGVSLAEILDTFVPRGWFLPVTPGTRFISVGGAIASDVHGKNHHLSGTFTQHVTQIHMLLGDGTQIVTSPIQHADLFYATCGGMGLTGIILSASIQLKPIRSSKLIETTLKAPSLKAILQTLAEHEQAPYSAAWIDCTATGRALGRSLFMIGEHAEDGNLTVSPNQSIQVPMNMPTHLLNQTTLKAFNTLYYRRARQTPRQTTYESFFYPLDKLTHWNRLYGKRGFIQYQLVIPKDAGETGLRDLLMRITQSGQRVFLAVLKQFGPANDNYLSFPMSGYTLSLDFKTEPAVFTLLNELDQMVLTLGGRLYLAKDARMNEATFKACYPHWHTFETIREKYHALGKFTSLQSKRLGLQ